MRRGIFGSMFDLNHDGEIDAFESAAEMCFLEQIEAEEEEEQSRDIFDDDDDFDDDFDDDDFDF